MTERMFSRRGLEGVDGECLREHDHRETRNYPRIFQELFTELDRRVVERLVEMALWIPFEGIAAGFPIFVGGQLPPYGLLYTRFSG